MLITRECDYALRAVRALSDGTKRSVKEVCDAEFIPQQYAYKILKKLENGGIVVSCRGANGGYELVKPLQDLSMLDIVLAVERELLLNECMNCDFDCPNNPANSPCTVHTELCRVQKVLTNALAEKNLQQLFA